MKKRALALFMAGVTVLSTLCACTKEEPAANREDNVKVEEEKDKDTEKPAEEKEEPVAETKENGFIGIWRYDKTRSLWYEIKEDGKWSSIDDMGNVSDGGTVKYSEDGEKAELIDKDGITNAIFTLDSDGAVFDEYFQETYTKVDELPDFDIEIDFSPIAGYWAYQQLDPDDLETFETTAYVYVKEDGTYTIIWNDDPSNTVGIIKQEYEEYADGSRIPLYSFFAGGNNYWLSCFADNEDPDVFYIGNGGMERFYREMGQGRVEFEGQYTEPISGRCSIEIKSIDGIHYSVNVIWSSGAAVSGNWEIEDAVYGESSGVLEYTGAKYYVRTFAEGGQEFTDDVMYTDGSGCFMFDEDGMLNWISDESDIDDINGSTLFEKIR